MPKYIKILNLISSIIPVILIFVPRTLDDNKGIFTSKGERKIISDLKRKIKSLTDEQENTKKKFEDQQKQIEKHKIEIDQYKAEMEQYKKEMGIKINKLLGKKRKKSISYEKEEGSEENKEKKEEKESKEEAESKEEIIIKKKKK